MYVFLFRITDTIENIVETPPKVIRVDIKPIDNKDKEGKLVLQQKYIALTELIWAPI